jgi:transposase
MIYIGIDVSSKEFVVHAINERKKVLIKGGKITPDKKGLKKMLDGLGGEQKLVVMEAGNQLKWIALYLKGRQDVDLHVVHPNEIKWINQSSGKTDKIDARKMAELGRGNLLPRKVHIVEGPIRELRELLSAREKLLQKRVDLVNCVRGLMKQEGVRIPKGFFAAGNWEQMLPVFKVAETQKLILKNIMTSIDSLRESESEILVKVREIEDPRIELLESIPGIGGLTARVLLSALDEAGRFDNKKCVAKYGALTPRIYQSGSRTNLGRINNDGRQELRRVLLQCAHTVSRMNQNYAAKPLYDFSKRIEKKRNKKIAVVAVARKLLTTAYGVLKHGCFYEPSLLTLEVA